MAVVGFDVISCAPLAGGIAFGEAGRYQEITGTLRMAVDPDNAANRGIIDLDLAPRGPDGLVHFDLDLVLTAPVEPAPNGRLLVDVPNRGRPVAARLNSAQGYPAASINDVGNGFVMRQGFTIARCGWQYDAPREPGRMRLRGPVAHHEGAPITGPALCHFQLPRRSQSVLLADRDHVPYPAADLEDADAALTVRPYWSAPRTTIPRSQWRFARDQNGTPVADPNHLWLESGFEPGLLYELVYTAANASIVGLGLL
ncbi:MAG: alpha/beta hydrolase domain-containing protein, partial [Candidatus Binatia bacterium]